MGRSSHAWRTDWCCQHRPIFLFLIPIIFAFISLFNKILTVGGQSNRCLSVIYRQRTGLRLVLLLLSSLIVVFGNLIFETLERIIAGVWKTLLWHARSRINACFGILSIHMLRMNWHVQIKVFVVFGRVNYLVVWVARCWNAVLIGCASPLFVKFWRRQTLRVFELSVDHLSRFVGPLSSPARLLLVVLSCGKLNLFGHWRKIFLICRGQSTRIYLQIEGLFGFIYQVRIVWEVVSIAGDACIVSCMVVLLLTCEFATLKPALICLRNGGHRGVYVVSDRIPLKFLLRAKVRIEKLLHNFLHLWLTFFTFCALRFTNCWHCLRSSHIGINQSVWGNFNQFVKSVIFDLLSIWGLECQNSANWDLLLVFNQKFAFSLLEVPYCLFLSLCLNMCLRQSFSEMTSWWELGFF